MSTLCTNPRSVLGSQEPILTTGVHVYCTYRSPFLGKKLQISTDLVNTSCYSKFSLTIGFIGVFQDFYGDSGGARTPDLMLRRPIDKRIFTSLFSSFYEKCTKPAQGRFDTSLVKDAKIHIHDRCTCEECETNTPCYSDCGECQGCYERQQERQEIEFEIGQAQGRFGFGSSLISNMWGVTEDEQFRWGDHRDHQMGKVQSEKRS
jgi:hypothetical protein